VPITLLREDLFAHTSALSDRVHHEGGFSRGELHRTRFLARPPRPCRLATRFGELARPGAILLIDNFRLHKHSHLGTKLEIPTRYHDERDMATALSAGG